MHEHENHLLRSKDLIFFGKIMAGQSHEVINVLNIINELAGLQGDMLEVAEQGRPLGLEKLRQVTEKIQNQVQRGETIVRFMNQFAHSVDSPVTIFDLKEALEQIAYLAQRSTNLRKTVLNQEFPRESIRLETSSFRLKQAVFTCIEIALTASSKERRITLSYQLLDRGAEITVTSADPITPDPSGTEKQDYLTLLIRELGGKVAAVPGAEAPHRFTLFFPCPALNAGAKDVAIQDHREEDSHAG